MGNFAYLVLATKFTQKFQRFRPADVTSREGFFHRIKKSRRCLLKLYNWFCMYRLHFCGHKLWTYIYMYIFWCTRNTWWIFTISNLQHLTVSSKEFWVFQVLSVCFLIVKSEKSLYIYIHFQPSWLIDFCGAIPAFSMLTYSYSWR